MARKHVPRKSIKKSNFRINRPILYIAGGILLFIGIIFLISRAASSPVTTQGPASAGIPYPDIQRVELAESKDALDQNAAVFLDVRSSSAFLASHIPGAVNIPVENLESLHTSLDPDDWIITYCT